MQLCICLLNDGHPQLVGVLAPPEHEVAVGLEHGKAVVHNDVDERAVLVEDADEDAVLAVLLAPPEALLQQLHLRGEHRQRAEEPAVAELALDDVAG